MSREQLSSYFKGAAAKRLSAVEVDPDKSHQHEFQGTVAMRAFLGDVSDRRRIAARFVYLSDETDPLIEEVELTYYDARAAQPNRSAEYRLYYPPDIEALRLARAGDLLLIAQKIDGALVALISPAGSSIESQVLWLFELGGLDSGGFTLADESALAGGIHPIDAEVLFAIFGVEPDVTDDLISSATVERFGLSLPTTRVFSEFARSLVPEVDPAEAPDQALMAWWETEYKAFQALERNIVSARLESGFHGTAAVEDFLSFSLSVQNRRKSRSGYAFESHLAAVFTAHGVAFTSQAKTELNARPDFLFPGQTEYDDLSFPADRLFMLGAKTTAKDRWRQILSEAERVPVKHLATLEPAISSNQTEEMQAQRVQLVVPQPLHATYTNEQQNWLWTIADFIRAASA